MIVGSAICGEKTLPGTLEFATANPQALERVLRAYFQVHTDAHQIEEGGVVCVL